MNSQINIRSYRENSDDDRFVIPELVGLDMYQLETLRPHLPERGVLLDCGAHIGVFSLCFHAHYPDYLIHSFEPCPENFQHLKNNCGDNAKITLSSSAVGVNSGVAQLYDQGDTGRWTFTPGFRQTVNDLAAPPSSIEVAVLDIYEIIRSAGSGQFLIVKLDLEGYEAEVINEMPECALSCIQMLILEEHHLPINHVKILQSGFELLFHPLGMSRHHVYLRPKRESV